MIENTNGDNDQKPKGQVYSFSVDQCRRKDSADASFNSKFERAALDLKPGEIGFLDEPHGMLVSTVGSGVALTIYDEKLHVGVMAYVVLPRSLLQVFPNLDKAPPEDVARALSPIEEAIAEMKKHGAAKNRIRIRLFGGAEIDGQDDAGMKTSVFVKEYLSRKELGLMGEDLGGKSLRRIHFLPDNGAVTRFFLKRQSDFDFVTRQESAFLNT
ncbi:MAG: chemotaxis protein CheD [Alphaproteobacteria bacterium]